MTDRTAAPEPVAQSANRTRRGGSSGQQAVGDYVGQPAGEAAKAVRRAGLRPGLDRSFGSPAELVGLVVAQDPAAGSDLARNGMVTLHVAAPGGDPAVEDTGVVAAAVDTADAELLPRATERAGGEPPTVARRPRRRKQGLASHATAPPEPVPPAAAPGALADGEAEQPIAQPVAAWLVAERALDGALENDLDGERECEFPHDDEFVVHAADVLAGRSGPPAWRGVYPRRRRALHDPGDASRVRGWLDEHRVLAAAVAAAVVLWMVVGVAWTLEGEHARHPVGALVARPSRGARDRSGAQGPPAARRSIAREAPPRSGRPHLTRAPSQTAPRTSSPARRPAVEPITEADTRTAPEQQAPPPTPQAPTPPPSAPPTPAPEQSGGGLFSP